MYQQDPFWWTDPTILYNKQRLIEFVPTTDMTTNEKLNAISRLLIYLGLLLMIIYNDVKYIYIPLIGLAVIYIIYQNYPFQKGGGCNVETAFTTPTVNNPFMNVLLTDYIANPNRPPAADVSNKQIQQQMDQNFGQGLYRDIDDIWNNTNSQRQYYTTPATTIPNDRDSFMKWCWNTPPTCKEGNLTQCLQYEDTRQHGQIK